ncbi:SigF/SigG family RNA polymerase sporulation sigma factor [Lachnospiraceae bacterium ZAX-1]
MDRTITLIEQSHQGDKSARDKLVQSNLGLVWSIVRRFDNRGAELEDLFQIGSIGLMKAIDKFDTTFEVRFSTYAVPMITGEIKRFLRDDGMIKVSRSLKENAAKIKGTESRLQKERCRDITLQELSDETGLSREEIVMALEANIEVESIYKTVYQSEGNEICLIDRLQEKKDSNERLLNTMLLEQLMEDLNEVERQLISLRYFKDKTQMEVAKYLGISQVQVSRLEKKILLRLRQHVV